MAHRLRRRLSIAFDINPRTPTITARNSRLDKVSALVYHTSAALVVFCTRSAAARVALLYVPVAVRVVVPVTVGVRVPVTVTVGRVVIGRVTVGVGAICTRRTGIVVSSDMLNVLVSVWYPGLETV